ncbi:MAG: hypothetical protein R3B81_15275 [bacterium]
MSRSPFLVVAFAALLGAPPVGASETPTSEPVTYVLAEGLGSTASPLPSSFSAGERAELQAILAEAAERAGALAASLAGETDPERIRRMQARIGEIKLAARVHQLSRLAALATAHGDLVTAADADAARRALIEPRPVVEGVEGRAFEKEVQE